MNNPNIIMKAHHGSWLYGTAIEGKSDIDYKGIFLPELKDLILRNKCNFIENSTSDDKIKNNKDDIDETIYSLQYFIELCAKGETVMMDMIHVRPDQCIISSPVWEFIYKNRSKFYTKKMKAYIGYCRGQVVKYSLKGEKLTDVKNVIKYLSGFNSNPKLGDVIEAFPTGTNIRYEEVLECREKDNRCVNVCGKKLMYSTPIMYALDTMLHLEKQYGDRARLCKDNGSIDWKSIQHAFRGAYQMLSIYKNGDVVFPLPEREFLIDIKLGKYNFINDGISQKLDDLLDEIEELSTKSTIPDRVNMKFWNDFILDCYEGKY